MQELFHIGAKGESLMTDLTYTHPTSNSYALYELAKQVIPGGVQGNIKYYDPYPLSFASAKGAWLKDVDGHHYVDYLLSFGALILGHGHSVVKQAVEEVWDTYGTSSFGVPYPLELTMGKKIKSLYPSIQQVRFTNSGLEATLLAIRLGMAYTEKSSIAKFAGHYHGGHEQVLVSTQPIINDGTHPRQVSESRGLPDYYLDHTIVLPFNDTETSERILRENQDQIGVVILEPLQSGYIPANPQFLQHLRRVTKELGMVLIFDEVKTGFRVRLGGAQELYDIQPDLTSLGKVLGGGFPIGAVGGRKDILEMTAPRPNAPHDVVFHSGTFNGNPMSLLSGLRTIEFLQDGDHYGTLLKMTENLRQEVERLGKRYGLPIKTVGEGSIFNIVFVNEQEGNGARPWDIVAAEQSAYHRRLRGQLDFLLMEHGVFSKPYNRFSLSLAHDDKAIQHTLDAFEKSFAALMKRG